MPETKRLYYTDSYLTRTQSQVIAASDDGLRITLEQTCFYPASGGQPHDLGTLNGVPVVNVVAEAGTIVHVLASPINSASVEGEILWSRRYDHMQQHTGQHLLSAVFERLFQIPTLSFRMGDEASTIELGTKELSAPRIESVVMQATELARVNPRIAISFEEADAAQGLRKLSEREGTLRIIESPGIDRSACGGTHVASLAEVLPVAIRDVDKVRGNIRVAFVCGNRAITQAQLDFETLSRIALTLGTSHANLEAHVVSLKRSLAASEKQRQRLETEAAMRAGLDLYASVSAGEDGVRRLLSAESAIDENARTKAKSFASQPKAVLLMHSSDGLLLACSADSGVNAGAVLKQTLSKYGAKGGGSATLAQGGLADKAILNDLSATLSLMESLG